MSLHGCEFTILCSLYHARQNSSTMHAHTHTQLSALPPANLEHLAENVFHQPPEKQTEVACVPHSFKPISPSFYCIIYYLIIYYLSIIHTSPTPCIQCSLSTPPSTVCLGGLFADINDNSGSINSVVHLENI